MRLDPQVQRLYLQLERELDAFPAGSRFYSLHEIAAKFRVHRRVIDAALIQMKSRGLIESVPRIGHFSKVTRKPDSHRVLLAEPDWPSGTTNRWSGAAAGSGTVCPTARSSCGRKNGTISAKCSSKTSPRSTTSTPASPSSGAKKTCRKSPSGMSYLTASAGAAWRSSATPAVKSSWTTCGF